jgi:hypothetical protein
VSGNAGDSVESTVAAVVWDDEGNAVEETASVAVTITDVLPSIAVSKTAEPGSVAEPGGTVQFAVRIRNEGPETVMLQTLVDDVYGDLNGEGACPVLGGQLSIGPGEVYECIFAGDVSGNAEDDIINTVTAVVIDDEGNEAQGSASATVTITISSSAWGRDTAWPWSRVSTTTGSPESLDTSQPDETVSFDGAERCTWRV